MRDFEAESRIPASVDLADFNSEAVLPFGLTTTHLYQAMQDFLIFLTAVNEALQQQGIERLETMMQSAGFSGLVGEFMVSRIPRYCGGLTKNRFHNGHPDLVPAGRYPGDAIRYATEGIEVKASRYASGWQGHNPEDAWLMVFVFDSNRPSDLELATPVLRPFRFVAVYGAQLAKEDWSFAGRSDTSRRTITASVRPSGRDRMMANWIYQAPTAGVPGQAPLLPM